MNEFFERKSALSGVGYSLNIFLYLMLSLLGGLILSALTVEGSLAQTAVSFVFAPLAMIVTIAIITVNSKQNFLTVVNAKKCNIKFFGFAVILSAAMFLGFGWINQLFGEFLVGVGVRVSTSKVMLNDAGQLVLFIFVACILPAVTEEGFFRGLVLNGVKGAGAVFSVFMTALIFTFFHCSLSQLIYQFIYGAFLAWLAIKADSVYPSMLAHFINNLIIVVLEYCKVGGWLLVNPIVISVGVALMVIFVALMVFPIKKVEKAVLSTEEKTAVKNDRKTFAVTCSLGLAICLVMIIMGAIGV